MRIMRPTLAAACVVALLLPPAAGAQAVVTVPGMSVSFVQPTGTVGPTASIPVWVRLALDPAAAAFTFDASAPGTAFNLPAAVVPTIGVWNGTLGSIAGFTFAFSTTTYGCFTSTFTPACGSSPYDFQFDSGPQSFIGLPSLAMAPGGALDFLFGTFTPQAGGAPNGTYAFTFAELEIQIQAFDPNGSPLVAGLSLGSTCPTAGCTPFTRTVVGGSTIAPEPASFALVGTGLVGLIAISRRRRR